MEILLHPAFIIFAVGSVLTFTVWLLRLEGVIKTVVRDHARLEKDFTVHENDDSIHQHEKLLTEFKIQYEKRFYQLGRTVEKSNDEVKVSLKDLNAKLDALTIKRSST